MRCWPRRARRACRVDADLRNEKITYKVREHSLAKVPVLMVVGKKEAAERTVSLRRLGSQEQVSMSLDAALKALAEEATPPDLKRGGGLKAVSRPALPLAILPYQGHAFPQSGGQAA